LLLEEVFHSIEWIFNPSSGRSTKNREMKRNFNPFRVLAVDSASKREEIKK